MLCDATQIKAARRKKGIHLHFEGIEEFSAKKMAISGHIWAIMCWIC